MAKKAFNCPGCQTPFYQQVPTCPICGHEFYALKHEVGLHSVFDVFFSPVITIRSFALAAFIPLLFIIPLLVLMVIVAWNTLPIVLDPVMFEHVRWEAVLKRSFIAFILFSTWYLLTLQVLKTGLTLLNHQMEYSKILQILNVSMTPFLLFLLIGLIFRLINFQGVELEGDATDLVTRFLYMTFPFIGFVMMTILSSIGLSKVTGLTTGQIFLVTILPIGITFLMFIVIVVLFVVGVLVG